MIRILITSSGGRLIPALTKFLKNDRQLGKVYIVGIDKKKIKKVISIDKSYIVKDLNKNKYLLKVLKICKKEKIEILIPYSDHEAKIISKFKKKFTKEGIKVIVNNKNIIDIISNKYLTYKILKKNGIQVPQFRLAKNCNELKKALIKFDYPNLPVVIKPIQGIGGRGVTILNGKKVKLQNWIGKGKRENIFQKEIKNFPKKIFNYGPLIIMEPLNSPAYDVDCFTFRKKQLIIIRKRINPTGIPYKGNYVVNDKKIINYCKKIIKILKVNSLVDLDLLTSKTGKPLLLEINPRPSGSAVFAHFANIPIFSYAIAKTMNKKYNLNFSKIMFNKKINLKSSK
tara:strand:- start:12407 stop:13429 length:1023 start_codon:yes stop_codon:yes gene_type:complete